jgi:hypothetical protein
MSDNDYSALSTKASLTLGLPDGTERTAAIDKSSSVTEISAVANKICGVAPGTRTQLLKDGWELLNSTAGTVESLGVANGKLYVRVVLPTTELVPLPGPTTITMSKFEVRDKKTFFRMDIQQEHSSWAVWHRYSQFDKLNAQLKTSLGIKSELPKMAPKTCMMKKQDDAFLDRRKRDLEQFMQDISNGDLPANKHLSRFLGLSAPLLEFLGGVHISFSGALKPNPILSLESASDPTTTEKPKNGKKAAPAKKEANPAKKEAAPAKKDAAPAPAQQSKEAKKLEAMLTRMDSIRATSAQFIESQEALVKQEQLVHLTSINAHLGAGNGVDSSALIKTLILQLRAAQAENTCLQMKQEQSVVADAPKSTAEAAPLVEALLEEVQYSLNHRYLCNTQPSSTHPLSLIPKSNQNCPSNARQCCNRSAGKAVFM